MKNNQNSRITHKGGEKSRKVKSQNEIEAEAFAQAELNAYAMTKNIAMDDWTAGYNKACRDIGKLMGKWSKSARAGKKNG